MILAAKRTISSAAYFIVLTAISSADCFSQASAASVRATVADTVMVLNKSRVWKDSLTLSRKTIVSTATADYLSDIRAIQISGDGRLLAITQRDEQHVLILSVAGGLRRKIGRKGSGPGEFVAASGVAWLPDNGVVVRDIGLNRATLFDSGGKFVSQVTVPSGEIVGPRAVTVSRNGAMFFGAWAPPRSALELNHAVVHEFDASSKEVRKIAVPMRFSEKCPLVRLTSPGTPILGQAPAIVWAIAQDGSLIVGCPSTYVFDIIRKSGKILRISRENISIIRSEGERDQIKEKFTRLMKREMRSWRWSGADIPATMPAYSAIFSALDGKLWVVTPRKSVRVLNSDGVSEWKTRWGFDVFSQDGQYLGPVTVPGDLKLSVPPAILGDSLWGVTEALDGNISVTMFTLQMPRR